MAKTFQRQHVNPKSFKLVRFFLVRSGFTWEIQKNQVEFRICLPDIFPNPTLIISWVDQQSLFYPLLNMLKQIHRTPSF